MAAALKDIVHGTKLNDRMLGSVLAQLKNISAQLTNGEGSRVVNNSPGASQVQQRTEGPNASNIYTNGANSPVTLGPNSPITINPNVNPNAPVITYDFDGQRRELSSHGVDLYPGPSEFPTMLKLYGSNEWSALLAVCEKGMKEVPAWITPYEFAGPAYLRMDIKSTKGIELLKEVERRAAGNPQYSDASRILNLLGIAR